MYGNSQDQLSAMHWPHRRLSREQQQHQQQQQLQAQQLQAQQQQRAGFGNACESMPFGASEFEPNFQCEYTVPFSNDMSSISGKAGQHTHAERERERERERDRIICIHTHTHTYCILYTRLAPTGFSEWFRDELSGTVFDSVGGWDGADGILWNRVCVVVSGEGDSMRNIAAVPLPEESSEVPLLAGFWHVHAKFSLFQDEAEAEGDQRGETEYDRTFNYTAVPAASSAVSKFLLKAGRFQALFGGKVPTSGSRQVALLRFGKLKWNVQKSSALVDNTL